MINKMKNKFNSIRNDVKNGREERERKKRELAEEEERKERERIQAEKEKLMALSEKELMIELIMSSRKYNERLSDIEDELKEISNNLSWLDTKLNMKD